MTTLLIAALAGGVALYVWSAVCWMVLPHHLKDFDTLGDSEDGVASALAGVAPGWYVMPHFKNFEQGIKDPALDERNKAGPNGSIIVTPPGPCMRPVVFLRSFLMNLVQAYGAAALIILTGAYVESLLEKVLLLTSVSVLIQSMPSLMNWNWGQFPLRSQASVIFDNTVGMAILAVVLHFVM